MEYRINFYFNSNLSISYDVTLESGDNTASILDEILNAREYAKKLFGVLENPTITLVPKEMLEEE